MNSFLVNTLGVEQEHIINLRDEQATRAAILEGFDSLIRNDDIKKDDAILIYYAGHGARDAKPEGEDWKTWASDEDHIEMICPVDIGEPMSTSSYEPILGIPDRTIAAKLNHLSGLKGNNIVSPFTPMRHSVLQPKRLCRSSFLTVAILQVPIAPCLNNPQVNNPQT